MCAVCVLVSDASQDPKKPDLGSDTAGKGPQPGYDR